MSDRNNDDREFAAVSEKEIFEEARDRLQIATEAESNNRSRAKEAMAFREGDQWPAQTSTTASQDEPEITINLTDALVTRVENNIRQQRPRGKCHPVGDGANVEVADLINGIGRHIEMRSEASIAYDTAATAALDGGDGYFRLIAEYLNPRSFQKELRILMIRNSFSVAMDPAAIMPHGGDQNWCVISMKMARQEYRRRWPNAPADAWAGLDGEDRNWEDREEIRVAEYFRIRERADKLYLIRGQGGEEFTKYHSEMPRVDGRVDIDQIKRSLADRGLRIDGERDSTKLQVEWFRLNGTKVIEKQMIPGQYIPVFRCAGRVKDIDGKVRRRGMVETMMDAARMVNYGQVAKIKRLGLTPKAPWIGTADQFAGHPEWDDANIKPYSKLTYEPHIIETASGPVMIPPPERLQPAQIEAGFTEFVQQMQSNLMAVAGMPNEPGQDAQGEVVSGVALRKRQFLSDQSHYQYYDNLTLAIAQCWRCMVQWIPTYYSEERMQRIIGEDSTPQLVKLNEQTPEGKVKNDLSVGTYDVVMDTGPGYETKREEGAENLIQLLKVQELAEIIAKTGADLVFRSIDHPYMQELADRIMATNPEGLEKIMEGLSERAKNIVQSLANENRALKQQVQQLEGEVKQGTVKAHMAALVKAHDTDTNAMVKVHDTNTKAQTAIDVAEITAGGKIIDSRAGRGHATDLAERQLLHESTQAALDRDHSSSEAAEDRELAQSTAQATQENQQ